MCWNRGGVGELGNVPGALGVMFSFNSIKGKWAGNEREMGNVLYIFMELIFIFQG